MWLNILCVFSSWKYDNVMVLLVLNGDEGKKDEYKHYIDFFLLNLSTVSTLFLNEEESEKCDNFTVRTF